MGRSVYDVKFNIIYKINNNNNINKKVQLVFHSVSGYFTNIQNMKLVNNKFKSGSLHEKHVVATWNLGKNLKIVGSNTAGGMGVFL